MHTCTRIGTHILHTQPTHHACMHACMHTHTCTHTHRAIKLNTHTYAYILIYIYKESILQSFKFACKTISQYLIPILLDLFCQNYRALQLGLLSCSRSQCSHNYLNVLPFLCTFKLVSIKLCVNNYILTNVIHHVCSSMCASCYIHRFIMINHVHNYITTCSI